MIALPRYAPLSTPFLLHLLNKDAEELRIQLQKNSRSLIRHMEEFEQGVQGVRPQVFARINEAVIGGHISIDWFRDLISQQRTEKASISKEAKEGSLVSKQTITVWRSKGLLGTARRGELNLDAVGAMLIASTIAEDQIRGFHPSFIPEHEPLYYCYSQSSPVAPWTICPFPLPKKLPRATLLWTGWPTWDPYWLQVGTYGAIRWAGATLEKNGAVRWTLNNEDLALWNVEIRGLGNLFDTARALHNQADTELLRLAGDRLLSLPSLLEEAYFEIVGE
jgi:hypothetical protein